MATPTEPTGALFRAPPQRWRGGRPIAYPADDEVRARAGQNVISAIGARIQAQGARIEAQITEFKAEMDTRFTELKSENTEIRAEMKAGFTEVNARIDAMGSRIDTLQKVIWPLIGLLATTVFGLLYKAVTS